MISKEELVNLIEEGNNFKSCMSILGISSRKLKLLRKTYDLDVKRLPKISRIGNCLICQKEVEYISGREKDKIFCSKSCANTRNHSEETKTAIRNTLISICVRKDRFCPECGVSMKYKRKSTQSCGKRCARKIFTKTDKGKEHYLYIGKLSAMNSVKRSKNEILFYEMCSNHFKNVEHNNAIFNGWDADIIIHDIKTAVLWNGKWHYEYIRGSQSLLQIQNRDRIKLKEIENYGYTPYVIKDMGRYSVKKVENEFKIFIDTINLKYHQ